jgi:hypothetical protein
MVMAAHAPSRHTLRMPAHAAARPHLLGIRRSGRLCRAGNAVSGQGAARGEKLIYVAEDPGAATMARLAEVTGPDVLQAVSIAEV